jgi:hypothetical protein
MRRIVTLAILAFLLFVAYDKGLPWLQDQLGQGPGLGDAAGDDPGTRCVRLAERAYNTFGESIGRVGGPGSDPGVWADFRDRVESEVYDAESACGCARRSCDKASDAMSALRDTLRDFDDRFRGSAGMSFNPASKQLAIDSLLTEARTLARQGE